LNVDQFDFELPDEAIALRPARPRDAARMLVVAPDGENLLADAGVAEFPEYLKSGDLLVLNDTRVIPARLRARREREGGTGAEIELLLHQRNADGAWSGFARPAKRLKPGDLLVFRRDQLWPR
jgi:S-adenosylmethionine:tRNA ribosyltransferase-isomerase